MPEIDLKQFLRKHGFRHLRDHDRGATWGNGALDIFVEKSYDKEPSKLRAVMDQVREAERKKIRLQKLEEWKMEKAQAAAASRPTTPEEHRLAQITAARAKEQEVEIDVPVIHRATGRQVNVDGTLGQQVREPEYATADTGSSASSTSVGGKRKKTVKKFIGDERRYVFGRIKAMFSAKMHHTKIADALNAEGIRMPNGSDVTPGYVNQMRLNWAAKPSAAAKYAEILYPRKNVPKAMTIEPPRPVVVAEAPKFSRSRFNLPLSVDALLADPQVSDDDRLKVMFVFVVPPETAEPMFNDAQIPARQKISVLETIGSRRERQTSASL